MKSLLTLMIVCLSFFAFSQDIVLSQDVKSDSIRPTNGPNLKNYKHLYVGLGFPVFTNEEVNYLKPGTSMVVDYGIRYKRRFNNTFALLADLSVNWASYKIKQDDGKSVPDTVVNDKAKFQINSLTPALFARINVGKRGNYIGNYLDLGAYGNWNWKKSYKTVNKIDNNQVERNAINRLSYIEPFAYGLMARIGIGRYAISARYRMSDLFKDGIHPELPRLTLGLELGILK
ncbi:MAG: outer membrane beta-barrel protein [Bacteroidetes bacterium]|nr:outer membrane beta-barrel protein [Bacteroidota bacterium]